MATFWVSGLTAGKAFVRQWRVHAKHRKHEHLIAAEGPCLNFSEFLSDEAVDVDAHFTFRLLGSKVKFYSDMRKDSVLGAQFDPHPMYIEYDMLLFVSVVNNSHELQQRPHISHTI